MGIGDFVYGRGDHLRVGRNGRPPTLRPCRRLRFVNRDARDTVVRTATSCRPCSGATGIAYPLADGPVAFDSGNLGHGPPLLTPAVIRATRRTPDLRPGTYAYVCPIHPFMRGAVRVAR